MTKFDNCIVFVLSAFDFFALRCFELFPQCSVILGLGSGSQLISFKSRLQQHATGVCLTTDTVYRFCHPVVLCWLLAVLLDLVALYILNLPSNLVLSFCGVQSRMLLIDWFSFKKRAGIRRYAYMLCVGRIFTLFSNIFTEITGDMNTSNRKQYFQVELHLKLSSN